ncbi:uncharacterized protein [Nicotiana tomentosiformis]|uniref:uncharacterized protein isoform X1 n=1 Tax=Nicotiana tomentosiformis TaxID=4098 RepID=UPI00051BDD4C|nr:importin-5-like isoform X1 [Nicotiana tomentosiformis]
MDTESTEFQRAEMEAILVTDSEEAFETLISDEMWNSEEKHLEAKSMFNLMKHKDPESLANNLIDFLCYSDNLDSPLRCAVLLCEFLSDQDDDIDWSTWGNLSEGTQSSIKHVLLSHMKIEESQSVILKLCDTVSKLAASLLPDNNWPGFFFNLAVVGNEPIFRWVTNMHSLFLSLLNDDTFNVELRMDALSAVTSLIQFIPNSNEKQRFQDLLPGMMRTLTLADASSNGEAARKTLESLLELAKYDPGFFRLQLVVVVGSILEIAEEEKLEQGTRYLAIEFLITLVETRKRAPGMMKRLPLFINRCFAMLLKLTLDTKDDPAWHTAETVYDETGATINYHVGMKCLNRFSAALGGNAVAHIAIEQISAYLAAPEWEKRHAALIALAHIAKGCLKVMIKNLEQVVDMVLNCFQDPHPRVRYAACYAIGQLLAEFSPHLQEQFHTQVLLALSAALDDFHSRVQACAMTALVDFGVPDKPETLIPYLDDFVNKLLVLMQNGKQLVQQEALRALASIAESVEGHFRTYYDTVMPHLKTVLRNTDLKSNLILRARAIKCISSVGLAGGKEKFRDDEKQVMEELMSLLGILQMKAVDPVTYYMLSACSNICKCLEQEFLPYMNVVMPFCIQCAQLKLDNKSIEKVKKRDVLEVKTKACNLLCYYADILKEDFYPWISQAVSIFVPLLDFYTREIRASAAKTMPILLRSAKLAVKKGIAKGESESSTKNLSDHIILSLLHAIHTEYVTETCAIMLDKLNDCLQICGPLLSESQVRSIVDEIKHAITKSSDRKQELTERAKTEDFDAEEAELLREAEIKQESVVFGNVGEILCTFIKSFKSSFLPFLDELSSYLLPMWAKEKTPSERCTSICIFDALMEECPEAALKYYDVCLPLVLDASNDEDPDVRQAALYGLGVWAEYDRTSFKHIVEEALSSINVVIMHKNALKPENVCAYDNAVSALGKICQFHGESIDSAQIIPAWLNCLPIKADLDDAKHVHELLCSMVERSDRELLGPNYEYLPKVISVFAEVLCSEKELATEETANRMIDALRHLQQTLPVVTMESAWSYILPREEMELKSIMSPEEDANFLPIQ